MHNSNLLTRLAFLGAFVLSIPNAALSAIFFMIAIGSLEFYFPGYGSQILMAISILLGVGFVIGESIANILAADKGSVKAAGVAVFFVLLLCGYVNIGAGNYRLKDTARQAANSAVLSVTSDPRWQVLEDERIKQLGILYNGKKFDDKDAQIALDRIAKDRQALIDEYRENSHVENLGKISELNTIDDVIQFVFGNSKAFAFALIAVNLIFGLCVQTAWKAKKPQKVVNVDNKKPVFDGDKSQKYGEMTPEKIKQILELCDKNRYKTGRNKGKPKFAFVGRKIGVSRQFVQRVYDEHKEK